MTIIRFAPMTFHHNIVSLHNNIERLAQKHFLFTFKISHPFIYPPVLLTIRVFDEDS